MVRVDLDSRLGRQASALRVRGLGKRRFTRILLLSVLMRLLRGRVVVRVALVALAVLGRKLRLLERAGVGARVRVVLLIEVGRRAAVVGRLLLVER